MNFDGTIKTVLREGRDYTTSLGLIKGSEIRKFDRIKSIKLIPYGEQKIKEIEVSVKMPAIAFCKNYYSATLYKQRNGKYIIKFKVTEVTEA